MKTFKLVFAVMVLFMSVSISAQELTNKQKLREKNKVEKFSSKEKDSMQLWFYNQSLKMGLSEDKFNAYSKIITENVYNIRRVNDKDKNRTEEEVLKKLDELIEKTNKEVKPLLNDQQYKMHLKNFGSLANTARKRNKTQE